MQPFETMLRNYNKIYPYLEDLIPGAWSLRNLLQTLAIYGHYQYPIPKKSIMDYDWDVLIILDACRYDLLTEVAQNHKFIPINNMSSITSVGYNTLSWIKNTFCVPPYQDVVYVSGNPTISVPYLKKHISKNKIFAHLEPAWDYGWDEDLGSVPAENVTSAALRIFRKYNDKRIIVHYMQPHYPFLGKIRLKKDFGIKKEEFFEKMKKSEKHLSVWQLLERGLYDREETWEAYKSNLDYVLNEVEELVKHLDGKIILTSDHGNCMGEYGFFGHTLMIRTEEMVKVPWVLLKDTKGNEKRKIAKAMKFTLQKLKITEE